MTDNAVLAFRIGAQSETVNVRVHPRARSVRLRVVPPGQIVVTVPRRFARRHLPEILAEHALWLEQTLAKVRAEAAQRHIEEPPTSITLPAIGIHWSVEMRNAPRGGVSIGGDSVVRLAVGPSGDWRDPLHNWLQRTARRHLAPWLDEVSREFGFAYSGLTIRAQKTRWGSCSARGHINLNRNLLFLQPEEVRYLLIHELCHTRHLNHSPRYWALVGQCMPEYRELDKGLRRAQARLPGWAQPVVVL